MTSGAKFKEKALNSFFAEINRNLSLPLEEDRLSHLLARVPAHNNPITEQLENL